MTGYVKGDNMAQYTGKEIDELVNSTKSITVSVNDSILRVETKDNIRNISLNPDLDPYPLITSILSYFMSNEVAYGEKSQQTIIDVCENICRPKFNDIIHNGVLSNKRITNIVLECCAYFTSIITTVNPLMVVTCKEEFMDRAFSSIYPYIVKRTNEARSLLNKI